MSSARASLGSATADPGAIGLSLFGFALFLYGVQFVVYAGAAPGAATSSVATIYAILVAAVGETLAGVLYILRGQGYQASILCGFGLWLLGLCLLLFLGIGFLAANLTAKPPVPPSVNMLRVSGILAWVATAALWYTAARIVLAIGRSPAEAAAPAAAGP